jgi:hypothetical protein
MLSGTIISEPTLNDVCLPRCALAANENTVNNKTNVMQIGFLVM